jgi:PST family polysaccharide transporter
MLRAASAWLGHKCRAERRPLLTTDASSMLRRLMVHSDAGSAAEMISGSSSLQDTNASIARSGSVDASIGADGHSMSVPSSHDNSARSVGRRAASGAIWVFLTFAAGRSLGVINNIILARLLSPDDFGLVSFSMILIGAFTILQDLGVPASIVYSRHDIRTIGATALTINLAASSLLLAATVAVAPFLANAGGDDAIASVVVVLAIGLVISSLGSVQRAMLIKELAFRRKFIPDFVPLIVSGVVSITLAFLGLGAWSLVIGYLVKVGMTTTLLWSLSAVRPRPHFEWSIARDLLGYGKHVSIASIVGFVGINADYFIVGHQLGTFDLGLYTLAFTISNLPCSLIGQVASTTMFPAYAQIRDDRESVLRLFADVFTVVSVLAIPAGIGIFVAGPAFIPIVFGDKWAGIERPLQVLAIYGALRTMATGFAPLYNALGHPSIDWRLNLVRIALLIPLMLLLLRYGLIGIPIAYVLLASVFIPANATIMSRVLQVPAGWFLRLIAPQLAGVAFAGLLIGLSSAAAPGATNGSDPVGAIVVTLLAILTYIATVTALNRRVVALVRGIARPGARPVARTGAAEPTR